MNTETIGILADLAIALSFVVAYSICTGNGVFRYFGSGTIAFFRKQMPGGRSVIQKRLAVILFIVSDNFSILHYKANISYCINADSRVLL
jgi:hypothetical protein